MKECTYCERSFSPSPHTPHTQKFCGSSCRDKFRYRNAEGRKASVIARVTQWQKDNPEAYLEKNKAWAAKNAERLKPLNVEKKRQYRARLARATPPWADLEAIKTFREMCPLGFEVDHVIPLKGRNVSGLNVVENLQFITPTANKQKGRSFHI